MICSGVSAAIAAAGPGPANAVNTNLGGIMSTYIGVKIIKAVPCACKEDIHNSKKFDPGYEVEYEDGYKSWSPKDVFEKAYRRTKGMPFGLALEAMKKGKSVRLPQWQEDIKIKAQFPDENSKMTAPYLYVESRFGMVPWKETMIELFSDDWEII